MNEQVLKKDLPAELPQPADSNGFFRWTFRVFSLAAIVIGGITLAFYLYQEVGGLETQAEEVEIESVPIVEAPVGDATEPPKEVPVTAITACITQQMIDDAEHPLVPLIDMAEYGQKLIEENVSDYTAMLTKRVRSKGKLQPEEKLSIKVRHASEAEGGKATPFSVYTRFENLKKGQEVIWVDGLNDNKLVAHGPVGLLNLMTLRLDPESKMAMNGNRYPIWTIGMLNLIKLMIEKANNDLDYEDCRVTLTRNVKMGDANCTRLVIIHDDQADHFEFHRAEIYIDDDRNLPIGFRSYDWPAEKGGRPRLQERYYYTEIELNVGLDDNDFDPANAEYDFPGS